MTASTESFTLLSETTEITWQPAARLARVRYLAGAQLTEKDGVALATALSGWIGSGDEPFGVLADTACLRGTDAEYRATAGAFFRQHHETARIAILHAGPLISIVVQMFRIATGTRLRAFSDELTACAWLRSSGVAV